MRGTNFARKAIKGDFDMSYLERIKILNSVMVQKLLNDQAHRLRRLNKNAKAAKLLLPVCTAR